MTESGARRLSPLRLLPLRLPPLWLQVLLAIALGIAVGAGFPRAGVALKPLGDGFVKLIRMTLAPIVFGTVVVGIARLGDLREVGRIGVKALVYFEVVSTVALLHGLAAVELLRPGAGMHVDPRTLDAGSVTTYANTARHIDFVSFVLDIIPASVGDAFVRGNILQLAQLTAGVWIVSAVFVAVVLGLIARAAGVSLPRFLRYIREELLVTFGTSSSEAVLAPLMTKMERLGCARPVVGLVMPTGYTFNADGTAIYLGMSALFIAQATDTPLSLRDKLVVLLVLMLTSKGSAGVAGAGFVALAATLASLHQIPVAGIALLLGVDRLTNAARAVTNVIGNGVATIVMARWEGEFDAERAARVLGGEDGGP